MNIEIINEDYDTDNCRNVVCEYYDTINCCCQYGTCQKLIDEENDD